MSGITLFSQESKWIIYFGETPRRDKYLFTLDVLKQQFTLRTDEQGDYFAQVAPVTISEGLRDHLQQYVPLALAIGTEKARSELLIMPVLIETHRQLHYGFSLFSGVEFNVIASVACMVPVTIC